MTEVEWETFSDMRGLVKRFNEKDPFPLVARQRMDGLRAYVMRIGDEVIILDQNANDVTEKYSSIIEEFTINQWPAEVALEGFVLGWSGELGHYSGDFVPLEKHEDANSFSFVAYQWLSIEDEESDWAILDSKFRLIENFPANGGNYIRMADSYFALWLCDVPSIIYLSNLGPGYKGIEYVTLDGKTVYHIDETQTAFAEEETVEPEPPKTFIHDFDIGTGDMDTPGGWWPSDGTTTDKWNSYYSLEPHFAEESDELPDFITIEGPAFPHGKLIDGRGTKLDYPMDTVAGTKLWKGEGQGLAHVNLNHMQNPSAQVGIVAKIWWDETKEFNFTDHYERQVSGTGMLYQRSIIKDEKAIYNLMNGGIHAISVEMQADFVETEEDLDFYPVTNLAMVGMALTNKPAIKSATVDKVCTDKGVCSKSEETQESG